MFGAFCFSRLVQIRRSNGSRKFTSD